MTLAAELVNCLSFSLSERCIHEDCTEGVVVNKDDKAVLLFVMC